MFDIHEACAHCIIAYSYAFQTTPSTPYAVVAETRSVNSPASSPISTMHPSSACRLFRRVPCEATFQLRKSARDFVAQGCLSSLVCHRCSGGASGRASRRSCGTTIVVAVAKTRHHALFLCWVMARRMVDCGRCCCDCGSALVAVLSCAERHCFMMVVKVRGWLEGSRVL